MAGRGPGLFTAVLFLLTGAAFLFCTGKVRKRRTLILLLMFLSAVTGFYRMNMVSDRPEISTYLDKSTKNISVTGIVTDISFSDEEYQIILKNPKVIFKENGTVRTCTSVGLKIFSASGCSFGDLIRAEGTLSPCKKATNEGQYDSYSHNIIRGIDAYFYADGITVLSGGEGFVYHIENFLYELSVKFRAGISTVFPNKEAGILTAMLTGERGELEEDIRELYSKVGIAHILSISGLHITLLGMGLFSIFMKVSHRLRFSVFISLTIIILYGLLTGFSVSTKRAVIMLACMLLARLPGKPYDGQSAGALAAVVILLKEPRFIFDSGFQMSFSAVFGIFAGNEILRETDVNNGILRYIVPGLFAQLAVLPVLLRNYYCYSPYGMIANLLLLPLMSVLILSGLLAGMFGMGYVDTGSLGILTGGRICGGPAYYILQFYEGFSEKLLELPAGNIITGCPDPVKTAIYYIIFFGLIYILVCRRPLWKYILEKAAKTQIRQQKIKLFSVTAMFIVSMLIVIFLKRRDRELYIAFLDVGQGQCIYVETGGQRYLIDGGSTSSTSVGKYVIKPYLMWQGVSRLDAVFVTHTDSDHVNGLTEIVKDGTIGIEKFYLGSNIMGSDSFMAFLVQNGFKVSKLSAGDQAEGFIRVLSPEAGAYFNDDNEGSLVAVLEKGDFSLLITGDSGFEAEGKYIQDKRLLSGKDITVLQVPHHGSKYSSSEALLNTISPRLAIISCAKYNSYGHPAPETIDRLEKYGAEIYSTPEYGRIAVEYNSVSGDAVISGFK